MELASTLDSFSSSPKSVSLSLRDPAGKLLDVGGKLIRVVRRGSAEDVEAVLASDIVRRGIAEGWIVGARPLSPVEIRPFESAIRDAGLDSAFGLVLEHPRLPFVSYPGEWAPEMLHAAGRLTLELAKQLLNDGLGLKDATPFNIVFRGPKPVFVDFLSMERRVADDPIWLPLDQFLRMFVNPLLAYRYFGLPCASAFAAGRIGYSAEEIRSLCGPIRKWAPPFLTLTTLPAMLSSSAAATAVSAKPHRTGNAEKAQFILKATWRRLESTLRRIRPQTSIQSKWSDYATAGESYSEESQAIKQKLLAGLFKTHAPTRVLDIGCNSGVYSRMAAKRGARVVAIDSDPVVVGKAWRSAYDENLDILPLVVDLARPTPATGWWNTETQSFLQRASGHFELVLMLAVIHHLRVSDGIPTSEIARLTARLTTRLAVVEFVPPTDPMFARIARGRTFPDVSAQDFESAFGRYFQIQWREPIEGSQRIVYVLQKRETAA